MDLSAYELATGRWSQHRFIPSRPDLPPLWVAQAAVRPRTARIWGGALFTEEHGPVEVRLQAPARFGVVASSPLFIFPVPGSSIARASDLSDQADYGPRTHPKTGQKNTFHSGLDLRAPTGTPVLAARDGVVDVVQYDHPINGHWVRVDHGDGLKSAYLHLSKVRTKKGQSVQAGDRLGDVGETGRATGPHLHFQVYQGSETIDPAPLITWPGEQAGTPPAKALPSASSAEGRRLPRPSPGQVLFMAELQTGQDAWLQSEWLGLETHSGEETDPDTYELWIQVDGFEPMRIKSEVEAKAGQTWFLSTKGGRAALFVQDPA